MSCEYNNDITAAFRSVAEMTYKKFLTDAEDWPSFYALMLNIFMSSELASLGFGCKTCQNALSNSVKHMHYAYIKARQDTPSDVSFYGFRAVFLDLLYTNIKEHISLITYKEKQL